MRREGIAHLNIGILLTELLLAVVVGVEHVLLGAGLQFLLSLDFFSFGIFTMHLPI